MKMAEFQCMMSIELMKKGHDPEHLPAKGSVFTVLCKKCHHLWQYTRFSQSWWFDDLGRCPVRGNYGGGNGR